MLCSDCPVLPHMVRTRCLPHIVAFIVGGGRCPRWVADLRAEAAGLPPGEVAEALNRAAETREREEARG